MIRFPTTSTVPSVLPMLVATMLVAGSLAGCGVRGGLEAPAEAKASGEATTPDDAAAAGSKVEQKPHRPFILDGLIR